MTAANSAAPSAAQKLDYDFDVVRLFVIASAFWGIAAFAVGVYIALQLAYPVLNLDLPWTSFGRLRPLHTSAAIFAFGGNILIGSSLYCVQRTCRASLFGGRDLALSMIWDYQLMLVLAGLGYIIGITQSKVYAEPEWYEDI